MRQRIEDLGRLAVMLKNLLDNELFEQRDVRNKDYCTWFNDQTEERRDDIIHGMVYKIDSAKDKIYDMISIAEGSDCLNEKE